MNKLRYTATPSPHRKGKWGVMDARDSRFICIRGVGLIMPQETATTLAESFNHPLDPASDPAPTLPKQLQDKQSFVPAWQHCVEKAQADRAWALQTADNLGWFNGACDISREMLREYLTTPLQQLAEQHFVYFHLRAHGMQGGLAVDPTARTLWVKLTGEVLPEGGNEHRNA